MFPADRGFSQEPQHLFQMWGKTFQPGSLTFRKPCGLISAICLGVPRRTASVASGQLPTSRFCSNVCGLLQADQVAATKSVFTLRSCFLCCFQRRGRGVVSFDAGLLSPGDRSLKVWVGTLPFFRAPARLTDRYFCAARSSPPAVNVTVAGETQLNTRCH